MKGPELGMYLQHDAKASAAGRYDLLGTRQDGPFEPLDVHSKQGRQKLLFFAHPIQGRLLDPARPSMVAKRVGRPDRISKRVRMFMKLDAAFRSAECDGHDHDPVSYVVNLDVTS
jgi:hypothetical protein